MDTRSEMGAASRLFTRTIREVRASPDRFAAGLALIAERFSTQTIRATAETEFAKIDASFMAGRPIPTFVVETYRHAIESASEPMGKIGELRKFVETLTVGMDRAEAQAALLMIAWVADDEPDFTTGLPALLEGWITEHWKGRRQPDRAERIASNRAMLSFLRHGLKHDVEWRARLAHVCMLAWDRMEAAGLLEADRVTLAPSLAREVGATDPLGVDPAEASREQLSVPNSAAPDLVPLSEAAQAVYEILCALPDTEGRTAKELVRELQTRKPPIVVGNRRIRGEVRDELRSRGIDNARRGYFIPTSRRPPT